MDSPGGMLEISNKWEEYDMWSLTIINKKGFSCYGAIEVDEIMDGGDYVGVTAGSMEMFLGKEYLRRNDDAVVWWKTEELEVYLENI